MLSEHFFASFFEVIDNMPFYFAKGLHIECKLFFCLLRLFAYKNKHFFDDAVFFLIFFNKEKKKNNVHSFCLYIIIINYTFAIVNVKTIIY